MMMKKICFCLFIVCFSFLTVSCGTMIGFRRFVPAEVTLPGVKTIAVFPFEGRSRDAGFQLADRISMAITNNGHFSVAERDQLSNILAEQGLSVSGLADDSSGVKIGKLLNADAVISGRITIFDIKNSSQNRNTKRGVETTYIRELNVAVNLKIIHTSTGRQIFGRTLRASKGLANIDQQNLPTEDELFDICSSDITAQIIRLICPHSELTKIELDTGKGNYQEILKPGIEFAKAGLTDRALDAFNEVLRANDKASPAAYNAAMMQYLQGKLDGAERDMNTAISLFPESNIQKITSLSLDKYSESLSLIRQEKVIQSKLERQIAEVSSEPTEPREESQALPGADWKKSIRIAVVIPEMLIKRPVPDPAGETRIIQLLLDDGYRVVEQASIAELRYSPEVAGAIKDATAAATLARKLKVHIIIIGEAFAEEAPPTGGFRSWRGRLEARAIFSDNQEIICTAGEYGSGADRSDLVAGKKALENAGEKVGKYFLGKFEEYHRERGGLSPSARASQGATRVAKVIVNAANIRMEPNTAAAIIATATMNESLKIIETTKDWFYIQKADGTEGWVYASLVKEIK
jgi:tetratricopeptide (TPR) repeat protein